MKPPIMTGLFFLSSLMNTY